MKSRLIKPMLAGGICAAAAGVLLTAGAGILLYQRRNYLRAMGGQPPGA